MHLRRPSLRQAAPEAAAGTGRVAGISAQEAAATASEDSDEVLIDLKTTSLTLGEVMERIQSLKSDPKYKGYEIFMDGDRYAIVARRRPE